MTPTSGLASSFSTHYQIPEGKGACPFMLALWLMSAKTVFQLSQLTYARSQYWTATSQRNINCSSHGRLYTTLCLKNDTDLACYNFDIHEPILIMFGRNVTKTHWKTAGSQIMTYSSISRK